MAKVSHFSVFTFLIIFSTLLFSAFSTLSSPALAQESNQENSKQGVLIDPAIQKIFWDQTGLREPVQNIVLTNTTEVPQAFTLEAIEFTNIDKYGGNVFLGQSIAEGNFKSASWIDLGDTELKLNPGEKSEITLSLQNYDSLAPGAHYGAILFRAIKPTGRENEDLSKVYLRQIAASLVYLSKEAGSEKKLALKEMRYSRSLFSLPDKVSLILTNEGNDFLEPRGFAEVKNFWGKEITRGILNETSLILFPGQEREIEARFGKSNYFLPGKYTLTAYYRFDDGEYKKESTSFWYWEPLALLTSVLLLLGILGLITLMKRKLQKTLKED